MGKSVAIITARSGSKRIPKKNIKEFCGNPIITYPIKEALESGIFDEVMVSTDSVQIASIAEKCGAKVPFLRSEKMSNDVATTSEVLLEVLDEYEKIGKNFENACCIYPTAVFMTKELLQNGMNMIQKYNVDLVIPIVAFSYPPQRGFIIKDSFLQLKYPEYIDARSQDLEKIYHDSGQFYLFNVEHFKKSKRLMTGHIMPLFMSDTEVQDIDTLEDWKIAEMKFRLLETKK